MGKDKVYSTKREINKLMRNILVLWSNRTICSVAFGFTEMGDCEFLKGLIMCYRSLAILNDIVV